MKFETLEINQCQNEACNQKFTLDNLKLAVWLHGVILLTQEGGPTGQDPMLPDQPEPDEKLESFNPQGYVGLTCPKCLEIGLYRGTCNDIREFKAQLQTSVNLSGLNPEDRVKQFKHDLRYYSPYGIDSEFREQFDVSWPYGFDDPEGDFGYFQSDLIVHASEELSEHWKMYCSLIGTQEAPFGFCTNIYWFQEKQILKILEAEKDNGVRIFPRYHYITELAHKIDALSKYNCESDDFISRAKRQYKSQEKERFEEYLKSSSAIGAENPQFKPLPFEKFLAEKQHPIINSSNLTGDFLDVLTSEPKTLVNIVGNPVENCNYLWSTIEPFEGKNYPEVFPVDSDIGTEQVDLEKHNEIVARVLENATKQYAQDFLKGNVVSFLEQYEKLIRSNKFSYADLWKLKEDYLTNLHEVVNTGLRDELPHAMFREGEGWKIVFNGQPLGGLRGKGFQWIYYTISNPGNKVFYRALHDWSVDTEEQKEETYDANEAKAFAKANQLGLSDASTLMKKNEAEMEDPETYTKAYTKLYLEKKEAESKGNSAKVDRKIHEISRFLNYLDENNIEYECDGPKLKLKTKATAETMKTTGTKDSTRTKYKIINDKIKKNYRDALTKLKGIREAKALHAHLSKSISKEDGAFIYKPSEDITWHLD